MHICYFVDSRKCTPLLALLSNASLPYLSFHFHSRRLFRLFLLINQVSDAVSSAPRLPAFNFERKISPRLTFIPIRFALLSYLPMFLSLLESHVIFNYSGPVHGLPCVPTCETFLPRFTQQHPGITVR